MPAPSHEEPQRVRIALGDRSYDILIGGGLLGQPASWDGLPSAAAALIVTNTTVAPLYGQRLRAALQGRYRSVFEVVLPDGEDHKDWATLNMVFDTLLARGCDRPVRCGRAGALHGTGRACPKFKGAREGPRPAPAASRSC